MLTYYAITNLSAWTLSGAWVPKAVAALGFVGCFVLVITLPPASVRAGVGVLLLGVAFYLIRRQVLGNARRSRPSPPERD